MPLSSPDVFGWFLDLKTCGQKSCCSSRIPFEREFATWRVRGRSEQVDESNWRYFMAYIG